MGGASGREVPAMEVLDQAEQDDEVPELLTVRQTALIMGCHRNTVYSQVRQFLATDGATGIPGVKVGGRVYVIRRALEEMLHIKIPCLPEPAQSKPPVAETPRTMPLAPSSGHYPLAHVARPGSKRASTASVGYLGRVVAQWRLRR